MKGRIHFRITEQEKKALKQASLRYGNSISDYLRRKLFFENEDLVEEVKYVSPPRSKHNIIVTTFLFKIYDLARELLMNQPGMTPEKLAEIEKKILQDARNSRARDGYKIFKPEDIKH